jgi:hypothetical protein
MYCLHQYHTGCVDWSAAGSIPGLESDNSKLHKANAALPVHIINRKQSKANNTRWRTQHLLTVTHLGWLTGAGWPCVAQTLG